MTIADLLLWAIVMYAGLMLAFPVLMTIWAKVEGTVLEIPAKIVFGLPFVLTNMIFNWTVMTAAFWPDKPENWYEQTTTRMKRYKELKDGRRYRFAKFTCDWLNRFHEGHC